MAKESKELKDKICDAISDGMTTAQASEAFGISKVTLYSWVRTDEAFRQAFDRAKDERIEAQLEDAVEVCERLEALEKDGFDKDRINAARLKVDTIKWFASKRLSKKYGDKLELGNIDDKPFQIAINKTYEK